MDKFKGKQNDRSRGNSDFEWLLTYESKQIKFNYQQQKIIQMTKYLIRIQSKLLKVWTRTPPNGGYSTSCVSWCTSYAVIDVLITWQTSSNLSQRGRRSTGTSDCTQRHCVDARRRSARQRSRSRARSPWIILRRHTQRGMKNKTKDVH